jgi:hypothetical protein
MSRTGKGSLLGGLAVLVLLLLFGCSLVLRDDAAATAGNGWYIELDIGGPAAAKGITVGEYQVTGLQIEVWNPEEEILQTIRWEAMQGPQSYLIPVTQTGRHEIVVTHIGERGGEVVEATESAAFTIEEMVITVIDIVPGCIGVIHIAGGGVQPPSLVGEWFGDDVGFPPGGGFMDAHIWIKEDGSYLTLVYDRSGTVMLPNSSQGTYTCTEDTITSCAEEVWDGHAWVSVGGMCWTVPYELAADTLTLFQDFDMDGIPETDWVLVRQ